MECILEQCSGFPSLQSEGLRTTKQLRANAGEVVRKGDHSLTTVRNENGEMGTDALEISMENPQKPKMNLPYDPLFSICP